MSRTLVVIAAVLALSSRARGQFVDHSLVGKPVVRAGGPNHNILGTIIAFDFSVPAAFVAVAAESGLHAFVVVTPNVVHGYGVAIFENRDCTGDPLAFPGSVVQGSYDLGNRTVFRISVVLKQRPDRPVLVQLDEPPVLRTVRSYWQDIYAIGPRCYSFDAPREEMTVHMAPVISMADFPPPYEFAEWIPPQSAAMRSEDCGSGTHEPSRQ